jgi:hypothetical protein
MTDKRIQQLALARQKRAQNDAERKRLKDAGQPLPDHLKKKDRLVKGGGEAAKRFVEELKQVNDDVAVSSGGRKRKAVEQGGRDTQAMDTSGGEIDFKTAAIAGAGLLALGAVCLANKQIKNAGLSSNFFGSAIPATGNNPAVPLNQLIPQDLPRVPGFTKVSGAPTGNGSMRPPSLGLYT